MSSSSSSTCHELLVMPCYFDICQRSDEKESQPAQRSERGLIFLKARRRLRDVTSPLPFLVEFYFKLH